MPRRRLLLASPHRYPDLARFWFRSVRRHLLPALTATGCEVRVAILVDAHAGAFDPAWFASGDGLPGAALHPAGRAGGDRRAPRDFIELYELALAESDDLLFLLDADVFFLDGSVVAAALPRLAEPSVAAVSFLRRSPQPGVYALLLDSARYRRLPAPVFAPCYEGIEDWPEGAVNLQPGDLAARRLAERGASIADASGEAAPAIADFHGTTVLRASREHFGRQLGDAGFVDLVTRRRYLAMGAYDNLLLGALYRRLFDAPFALPAGAAAAGGGELAGSLTPEELMRALAAVRDRKVVATLSEYFRRSDDALVRLARAEGLDRAAAGRLVAAVRRVVPRHWGDGTEAGDHGAGDG